MFTRGFTTDGEAKIHAVTIFYNTDHMITLHTLVAFTSPKFPPGVFPAEVKFRLTLVRQYHVKCKSFSTETKPSLKWLKRLMLTLESNLVRQNIIGTELPLG